MENLKRRGFLWGIITFSLSVSVTGFAAPQVDLIPMISHSFRVDSNYFRAEDVDRAVGTYLFQPGIKLGIERAKSQLLLDYTLDLYLYDDIDPVPPGQSPADEANFTGHTATINARYRPFVRLLMGLDDSFYNTRDPAQSDRFNNAVDREKYNINRLTPLFVYEIDPKLSAGLRYRKTDIKYNLATKEGSSEDRGMFDLIYNFTRNTSLDLDYQRWKRDYELTTSNYISEQIQVTFRKQSKHFSFEAGGGYLKREFANEALQNIDMFVYRIVLKAQNPSPPATPRSSLSAIAEKKLNDQGLGDQYYKATRLTLSAVHSFMDNLSVNLSGFYQGSDYVTPGLRDDDAYNISVRIGYMFTDWLTCFISTGYESRDSNLTGMDYENNYYMLSFAFGFNRNSK